MKKRRFWLSCLTIVMLASLLSACSGGKDNSKAGSNTSAGSGNGAQEEKLDKVTFTYFNAVAGKDINTNETTIGKIFEEQTGVNFKIEHLVGDENTKVGTFIASNSYPDVLVPGGSIDKLLSSGSFIPLNDLIDQYGPNIKRVYEPYYNLMKAEDGNIYFLPMSAVVGEYISAPNIEQGAFWIQRRVLKEAGYPKIKTFDDYLNLIRDYVKKHPGEDLTGYIALTTQDQFFALTNPPMHLAGYPNDGGVIIDMESHEANDYADDEITKRYLQELNKLNAEGLFDKSSFVDNRDQYLAKIASGKVLGFFDYRWQVGQAMNNLREAAQQTGNDDLEYMALPIVFDENTKDQYLDPPSFVNNRGVGISVSAKDPVRIIKYFDNLLTDENQILSNWGIEGETYSVDENGRFYRTEEQIKQTNAESFRESFGFKYFEYNWPRYGNGSSLPDGNSVGAGRQPEVAQMSYSDSDKKLLEAYGIKSFSQLFAAPDERPWYPAWSIQIEQGSPAQIFTQKKGDLQRKYFPKLVLANPAEFDKIWDEYVKEFNKLGVKDYEQLMTDEVAKKVDLVQGK
ncbi:ABC transporter substrate-binding protein [Paenibacillus sp. FSL W8-0186]|uniref:ABC transporter substrate-binding protein n=1 Tax=Paenibacillus woosongensis TaxID=307580 RepID=A0ABQ4MXK7_9BACL|nr:ABC transporter substrate-binding protein [Paenibacillus woosongensis]GIP60649.1 ABC transporter substrate-binding protein [Paenibacillus woosongensis]